MAAVAHRANRGSHYEPQRTGTAAVNGNWLVIPAG
jgi:hypothetical protein